MAEDLYNNMSVDELGSSLLAKKADADRAAAKKSKKNQRVQQALALLLMGQGVMKGQYKKRMKELDSMHSFETLNAKDKAQQLNVNATILNTIGNKWDGTGGVEGFENSEDYLGFQQVVRPFIDQKIKAMTADEYDTVYGTSTYENTMNLASQAYAKKYLEVDSKTGKANYLAYQDGLRELLGDDSIDMDKNELFQTSMGLDASSLTMYQKRNYQKVLAQFKSQGNLVGGFKKVLGLFNKDFKSKGGFDIFSKVSEDALAGPTIRDLNTSMNLKGMTNNIVSKALAEASTSPTRWKERARGKRYELDRTNMGAIWLPNMTNLIKEGRYPSELKTDTFISKGNWTEFMRDISPADKESLILDSTALSIRLKEDSKFLRSVYNKTEGTKTNGKSFNEFKTILNDKENRAMFSAMIVTDIGFKDESWLPMKQESYNSYGTLTAVYNKYNIAPLIGDGVKVDNRGNIDLGTSYIEASKNTKKSLIKSTVKDILARSSDAQRAIKLGGELNDEINKLFNMDSQAFTEMLAREEMGSGDSEKSLEEKIQERIGKLPEQTPFGSFASGNSRERNIIMQETTKEKKEERKTLDEKKNTIASGLRDIEKSKTKAINRNLFTLPSEKEAKEIQDENARLVSSILQSKYGLSTNTSNVQKLNNKLNTLLTDSPETYDEIIDVINNKDDKDYLESLMNEKKKIKINNNYENPEYNKLLNIHLDRLSIDNKEIATQDLNELSDFILESESDGDFNAANPNSSARGGYQFIKGSVGPAINRLEKYLGPMPRFDEVRKTGDVRSLSSEDQTLLFMADILEKKGSDKLINKFLNADNRKDKQNAAYEIYTVLHHTTDKEGKIPLKAKLQTKFKLRNYFNE